MDPQQRWLLETSYRALENGMSSSNPQPAVTSKPLLTLYSWYSPGESSRNQYSSLRFIYLRRLHYDDCKRPRSCAADGVHLYEPEHSGKPAQLVLRPKRSQHTRQHCLFIQYDHHGSCVPEPEERAEFHGIRSRGGELSSNVEKR